MRWIGFVFLALAATAVQVSLGAILRVPLGGSGLSLAVDFLGILAVAVGLRASDAVQAALAGWCLGLLIDLSTTGTPVGLYALAFATATAVVGQIRPAVFVENPLTQGTVTLVFCLLAHAPARAFISLYVGAGGGLGRELAQTLVLALCTAAVAPLVIRALRPVSGLVFLDHRRRR